MKKIVIGIDIGGTNTVFGLVNREGNIISEKTIKTLDYKDSLSKFLDKIAYDIKELISEQKDIEVLGVGCGAPCANYYTGTISNATNLPWGNIDLSKELNQRLGLLTIITNDANAAAMGEMIYGGAKNINDFVMITLGTGIGSAIVTNGELLYGHDGFAGEVGHIIVSEQGRDCNCGRKGCLECYASATGICRTVIELLSNSIYPSNLRTVSYDKLTSKIITQEANNGDPIALEAFRQVGQKLGLALANLVAITSPSTIFLFGGLTNAGEHLFEPTRKYMEENMLFLYSNKVKLLPSMLKGKNISILGASALIWQKLEKNK